MSLNPDEVMSYWPALVGTVRKLLPLEDCAVWEDLAADAVEKALRNAHRFEDTAGRGPYSWLMTIAAHLTIDYKRLLKNRRRPLPLTEWSAGTVDAGSERQVAHLDLQAAVATLPPSLTEFVALRLQGVDAHPAGLRIGLRSKKAAWLRDQAARKLLRPRLEVVS
jgi:DNA-directed RNA polymerase specialized sigma24 family protein